MGGKSVFTGAEYQASVAAVVMVHMTTETRLNWLENMTDQPVSISGETGGAGDDLRTDLASGSFIEIQAKRTIQGRKALADTLLAILSRTKEGATPEAVVLAVGAGTIPEILDTFANDIRRLRQGRSDVRSITTYVRDQVPGVDALLNVLRVIPIDLDNLSSSGTSAAVATLRLALQNPDDVESAWDTLVGEGIRLCKGGRIDREGLAALLRSRQFALRPVGPDARWELALDHARGLLRRHLPKTARGFLLDLERELGTRPISPRVKARLHYLLGTALHLTDDHSGATDRFEQALVYLPAPRQSDLDIPGGGARSEGVVTWADVTINLSAALHAQKNAADAMAVLRPVLSQMPAIPIAWSVGKQIAYALGEALPSPPPGISTSPEMNEAEAIVAMLSQEWDKAAEISSALIATGYVPPRLFALRATALANRVSPSLDPATRQALLLEAERGATAAIERLEDTELDHSLTAALVARAAVREELEKPEDAAIDYAKLEALNPAEPDLVRRKVGKLQRAGDTGAALALLNDALVQREPRFRLLRASVAEAAGDSALARRDLEEALESKKFDLSEWSDDFFIQAAEIATKIEAAEIAMSALARVSAAAPVFFVRVLQGRAAFLRNDIDNGDRLYSEAFDATTDEGQRTKLVVEWASMLNSAGQFARALAIHEKIVDPSDSGYPGFRSYLGALYRAEQFDRIGEIIQNQEANAASTGGELASLPTWLLRMGLDIAWQRDDFISVVHFGLPLVEHFGDIDAQLVVANSYLRLKQRESALRLLQQVINRDNIAPEDRMAAANLLQITGENGEAVAQAFRALRSKPDDKQMIMGFIAIITSTEAALTPPEGDVIREAEPLHDSGLVTPDCWVRLVAEGSDPVEYTIYNDPPADAGKGEYLATDPVVADLVGKARGDVIIRNLGRWNQRHYRIEVILPAVVRAFQRDVAEFESRFPDSQFIQQYHVGENPTKESLGPILATIKAGADSEERVWRYYDAKRLPIAVIATAFKRPLGETIASITRVPERYWFVEEPFSERFQQSVRIARAAKRIVITRQCFTALVALDIFDKLFAKGDILVPESLLHELDSEVDHWESINRQGRKGLFEQAGSFGVSELLPGQVEPWLRRLQHGIEQIRNHGIVTRRPFAALTKRNRDWRNEVLGASSADAIMVARADAATLYVDDWGLRGVAATEFDVESFSTIALITGLSEDAIIIDKERDELIVQLISVQQYFIPIHAGTIEAALRKDARVARVVIDRLSDPNLDVLSAVGVGVNALRAIALTPLISMSIREATIVISRALLKDRSAVEVTALFTRVTQQHFRLMPVQLEEIVSSFNEVVRISGYLPTIRGE
jgi:tetratricopeptide (TPR) repeat protein